MNLTDAIALFFILLALAATPSTSVALVVTRSATLGVWNGIAVSAGIVLGDLVFIVLAVYGLSVIAETMGWLFLSIKYIGGGYLIWIGYTLIRSRKNMNLSLENSSSTGNLLNSFLSGFFLTLGDIKAIFFYVSLFPTFVDLDSLSTKDLALIAFVTIITVGGVKVTYAYSAVKLVKVSHHQNYENIAKKLVGSLMFIAGISFIFKA